VRMGRHAGPQTALQLSVAAAHPLLSPPTAPRETRRSEWLKGKAHHEMLSRLTLEALFANCATALAEPACASRLKRRSRGVHDLRSSA